MKVASFHVVAMGAIVVAAIGQRQVYSIRCGRTGGKGHDGFETKIMDRASSIRTDKFLELTAQHLQVGTNLGSVDMIFMPDEA